MNVPYTIYIAMTLDDGNSQWARLLLPARVLDTVENAPLTF